MISDYSALSRRQFLGGSLAGFSLATFPIIAHTAPVSIELAAAASKVRIGEYTGVPVWLYNQSSPGPEIRVKQGERLNVTLANSLENPTSIHWHGIRIENGMDGVPDLTQKKVMPGERFDYSFVTPDAGTYWYHSHVSSSEQVGRGLYGALIVDETESYPVDREVTLVIDDWRINEAGVIDPSFRNLHDISHAGRLGNWMTVNGVNRPDLPVVAGERLRIRLLNVANARILTLQFDELMPWVIALDGQPYGPVRLADAKLTLAPGQRADLVIDIPGTSAKDYGLNLLHSRGVLQLARMVVQSSQKRNFNDDPGALPANPLAVDFDLENARTVELQMQGGAMGRMRTAVYRGESLEIRQLVNEGKAWALNGVSDRPREPLFSVQRGRTVVIDMHNMNRWPHAMHVHGHHFRVIEANGENTDASPWRDTTLMYGHDRVRIAFVADNPGRWLLHCHMLEHAAGGMTTWFEVT